MSDNRLDITIECGADFALSFLVRDDEGTLIDLTGATVEAQVREYAEAADYFAFTAVHNGQGGRVSLSMPHEVTASIGFSRGVYDVFIDYPDESREKYLMGDVTVIPEVTKPAAGTVVYVLSFSSEDDLPLAGLTDRLYFCHASNKLYRWNGTNYVGLNQDGENATIDIGTVTTLEPGEDATVENVGTETHAVLNFGLPTGPRGETGETGATGEQGPQGLPGINGGGSAHVDEDNEQLVLENDGGDYYTNAEVDALLALKPDIEDAAPIIHATASGSVVSIADGAPFPVDSLTVSVLPIQDLHGYDHPWAAGCGKNLALVNADHVTSQQNCTYSFTNNGIAAVSTANYGRIGFSWTVTEGETYTISYTASRTDGGSQYPRLLYSTANNVWSTTGTGYLSHQTFTTTPTRYSYTFTATSSGIIFVGVYIGTTTYGATVTVKDFMIEKAASASSFAPYSNVCSISGQTEANIYHEDEYDAAADPMATLAFGQTVYGGSLNVLTGVLTVTDAQIASYAGETLPGEWISDRDAYAPGETPTTGAQVVYKLATATTIQLTAQQVSTLLGSNAIWADCGNVTLGYRADTKLYVNDQITAAALATRSMITGVESAMTATQNYTSGALIIVGDDLYKATSNIANGSALTIGSNVTKVTLAEYILSLL